VPVWCHAAPRYAPRTTVDDARADEAEWPNVIVEYFLPKSGDFVEVHSHWPEI